MSDRLNPEIEDIDIRAVVTRLARPRVGGGYVIERAAIRAVGSDCAVIEAWILDHAGRLEQTAATPGGLHPARPDGAGQSNRAARRFVLPRGALHAIHNSSH